jgi:dual specificity phosphatase 12
VAGRSRSSTIVAAYLMYRFNIGVGEALERIQKVREVEPNSGFREQLQVYLDCNFEANSSKAAYRHWQLRRETRLQKGMLDTLTCADVKILRASMANRIM